MNERNMQFFGKSREEYIDKPFLGKRLKLLNFYMNAAGVSKIKKSRINSGHLTTFSINIKCLKIIINEYNLLEGQ